MFFMGFACGDHDCIDQIFVSFGPEYKAHFEELHKSKITTIALLWKIRQ